MSRPTIWGPRSWGQDYAGTINTRTVASVGRSKYIVQKKWSEQDMTNAIKEWKKNDKLPKFSQLASKYGVPRTTLQTRCKKQSPVRKHGPIEKVFNSEHEHRIIEELKDISAVFFGCSRDALAEKAYILATELKLKNNFNSLNKKAGYDWYTAFLRRHQNEVEFKTATPYQCIITPGFTKLNVNNFFDKLKDVLMKNQDITANRIYAADITSVTIVTKEFEVVGEIGKRFAHKLVRKNANNIVSVIFAANASGETYIAPFFLFPEDVNFSVKLEEGPAGCDGVSTKIGRITSDSFIKWLQHFWEETQPSKINPVLLIVTHNKGFISFLVLEFCTTHDIVLLLLPPETENKLNPLQKPFLCRLEDQYSDAMKHWKIRHGQIKPELFDIPALLNPIFSKTKTLEIAANGFKKTGIYLPSSRSPNRQIHSDAAFTSENLAMSKSKSNGNQNKGATCDNVMSSHNSEDKEKDAESIEVVTIGDENCSSSTSATSSLQKKRNEMQYSCDDESPVISINEPVFLSISNEDVVNVEVTSIDDDEYHDMDVTLDGPVVLINDFKSTILPIQGLQCLQAMELHTVAAKTQSAAVSSFTFAVDYNSTSCQFSSLTATQSEAVVGDADATLNFTRVILPQKPNLQTTVVSNATIVPKQNQQRSGPRRSVQFLEP